MANCEWRVANGKTSGRRRSVREFVSRSSRVAGCHGYCRELLSTDRVLSKGRALRADLSNSTFGGIYRGQHCRGSWPSEHGIVPAVPANSPRIAQGARNASHPVREGWARDRRDNRTSSRALRHTGSTAAFVDPVPSRKCRRRSGVRSGPKSSTRHSLLTTRHG